VPAGDTQGAAHVTVKVAVVIVAGFISVVKAASMAELVGTPVVGPGMVVTGAVDVTPGRVVADDAPVVKCQT
jgi:hypothetical protein